MNDSATVVFVETRVGLPLRVVPPSFRAANSSSRRGSYVTPTMVSSPLFRATIVAKSGMPKE